jgi:hypothetical protein
VRAPGLLGNDRGSKLLAHLRTPPKHGDAVVTRSGRFRYLPDAGFIGVDTFTYRVLDSYGVWSAAATVTVHVGSTNAIPVAVADSYQAYEDITLIVGAPGVLANDTDDNGDALVAEIVTYATSGFVDLLPDGSFTFDTDLNADGDVSFTYRVGDGTNWSEPVLVSIDVIATNDPPVAENDYFAATSGEANSYPAPGPLVNDYDPVEFDGLTARLDTQPQTGTVTMSTDGSFTFVADPGASRFDSFSYSACDPGGCAPGEVTLEIFGPDE